MCLRVWEGGGCMKPLLHYYSTNLDTRSINFSVALQYFRTGAEACMRCKLQHSTFPRKRVRVHKIVLTENVLVAKLVPNAKTVNISTNISVVVHATVIQHLKINCCWYIIVVEMIERGNFLLHLSILLTCSRIVIVYLRNLF